jgi:phosphoglycerol transferase MdoB-like AlkP superfamily enzyme
LQYVGKKLDVISEPFFSTIFTLSSHQPYDLPKAYIEVFKEDKLPILKTIEYSDFAVKKFFESNKDKTWFHNTLFIFTADHTQQRRKKENLTYLGQFKVPFFIYTTGGLSSSLNDNHIDQNLTQHSDLKKTLLTSLGIDFGSKPLNNQSSFFCQRKTPILLSLNKKQILSLTDDSALLLDKKTGKVEKVYSLSTNGLTETQINDKSDLVEKTLFYWQSFIDSMINNLNSF